ncbi:hypothetical protein BC834DRAFT_847871 [Gloeopeniophorella convolvens]|nr:hypothetical protein BC834DRAFT_847871 [Gloeopeniophorella convolvens]
MLRDDELATILGVFRDFSPSDVITALLNSRAHSAAASSFVSMLPILFTTLQNHPWTAARVKQLILQASEDIYRQDICLLIAKKSGWQFGAWNASAEQLINFSLISMADQLSQQAPSVWSLLGILLNADLTREIRRMQALMTGTVQPAGSNDEDAWDEDDEYFARLDEEGGLEARIDQSEDIEKDVNNGDGMSKRQRRAITRRTMLLRIVRV